MASVIYRFCKTFPYKSVNDMNLLRLLEEEENQTLLRNAPSSTSMVETDSRFDFRFINSSGCHFLHLQFTLS